MTVSPERLTILTYPHPALRKRAAEVELTDEVRQVARRMIDLMREARGIGLAAPQVGLSWRLFVAEVFPDEEEGEHETAAALNGGSARIPWTEGPVGYINPVISEPQRPIESYDEAFLSLPEISGRVMRPPLVT